MIGERTQNNVTLDRLTDKDAPITALDGGGLSSLSVNFDRSSAVNYALRYALSYNPAYNSYASSGGDCANFVSQALSAAGLVQTNVWKKDSVAWINAQQMANYLLSSGSAVKRNSVSALDVGDVVSFSWDGGPVSDHVMLVTSINASGERLLSGHTNDTKNMAYSVIAAANPKMIATFLHVDTAAAPPVVVPPPIPTPVPLPTPGADRFTSRILRTSSLAVNYNIPTGNKLFLWSLDGSDDQRWNFIRQRNPNGDSQYVVQRAGTNMCLNSYLPANGAAANLYTCNGGDGDQQWRVLPFPKYGSKTVVLQRVNNGRGTYCLNAYSPAANRLLNVWACNELDGDQRMILPDAPSSVAN